MWIKGIRKLNILMICVLAASLIAACSGRGTQSTYKYQQPADLGDGWQTASLQDDGLDVQKLTAMMEDIQDGGFYDLHSLLIVKDGRLVFEEYFHNYNQNRIQGVASVTKSVTSILIGIAIDQGLIKGVNQSLSELLPAYRDLLDADPLKQKLQLWHILTMTSGLQWDEDMYPYGDSRNDATRMERSADAVRFVLDRPMAREPGQQFQYCGGNSMLLSAILEEATGMKATEFARESLFEPLGISVYQWDAYADGHTNTDGGLSLRPRDMAKIGQLMLNSGDWQGAQIVSPEWVAESTRARTNAGIARYGYQWWRDSQSVLLETVETYFAAGYGGQMISVYPEQDMVIVFTHTTANHDENSMHIMFLQSKYLLPASVPAVFSKVVLGVWYLLTIAGLVFMIIDFVRGKMRGYGQALYWLLIGTAFGPLGLVAYLLSYRNPRARQATGWKALGLASFLAMGHLAGFILVTVFQGLVYPNIDAILLVIPAAFLVNWLAFIAPFASATKEISYGKAIWRTKLTAFITASFALASFSPLFATLAVRRMFFSTVSRSASASSVLTISMSASGSTLPSTWTTLSSSKQRTTCTMASVSRIFARNLLPSPSPLEAPATSPAISTNSMAVGITFSGLTISASLSWRGSGTGTTPTFGSMVQKG